MSRSVVFLDRDGTLNVDRGYVHSESQWEFFPDVIESLKMLRSHGFALAIVTNQSGVARGLFTCNDVDVLHRWLSKQFEANGVEVAAIAYCPHAAEDQCECRKPATGLAQLIARQLGEPIDYASSWMVGDKTSDVAFGQFLGMNTILLRSRYWTEENLSLRPTIVAGSLGEATRSICQAHEPSSEEPE